jgi:sigma-B regulation protein RsbU (phosphoserine phosphatase)
MSIALRILLIEDSDDDAALLVRELRRGGYEPTSLRVDTEAKLCEALDAQSWDVITCDWVMPRFSAPAALELLRQRGCDIPVIIVSGEVGEEVAVSALKGGARDYIGKHRLTRLVPAIERELREHEEHRARQRAEASLRQTRERLRRYIEHASDLIFTLDAQARITSVNRAVTELTGYRTEELIGGNALDDLAPEARERASGELRALSDGGAFDARELALVTKDGRRVVVEVRGHAVREGDRYVESFHIARDITARRRAEAERARLSAALEQAPETIAITDADGLVVYLNPAGERLTGLSRAEACGQPFNALLGEGEEVPFLGELLTEKGEWTGQFIRRRRRDGRLFRLEVSVSTVRDEAGRIVNYVGRARATAQDAATQPRG